MEKRRYLFTSESVGEGHPDKVCDQISDGILDCVLRQDPYGRVACETYVTMGLLIVGGEITTTGFVDVHNLTRNILKEIGYDHPKYGFDYHTCAVINTIHSQSPDIAQGVNTGGAGDQGFMVGYACRETPELMPLPIMLAHHLVRKTAEVRRAKILKYLGPDCKSQVSVEYVDGHPKRVDSVVIACQHTEEILDSSGMHITKKAKQEIIDEIVKPIVKEYLDKDTKFYINETGKFVVGGPQSDTGMTGRKIVVDTYGGMVASGGGAFSGKDPTKVDRSAAYMGRYIAKNIVAAGIAEKCLIHVAYVIGKAEPLAVMVDTYGTGKISEPAIEKLIKNNFDMTPQGMIQSLDLLRPIYRKTACYGHFGRTEPEFSWELTDKAQLLKKQAAKL
ncbi:MAG: methionine adenosyltransferase [Omnitrophica WOR_2 bacterium GWF2_43_52]|nr:MAG: methionine adenosyltransferase [Omnitrophica WOR_2 bacterium GWA2_44_7]OGX14586.1 MAG: methionine adenosyltransferase [Omnitrophica WOR_2 bacterium GWC2_44_8]OGX20782.1 MAG: methionine adenosyltransferase [Omnitrophica WOR_2 bacterium GWF2_43_52]HAH19809.1 methionine adenosyltransferase [Candidatus Omnitrophota bacterium]HBG63434.1 methionine adenosyltransferase [Candidatus Omnitrophota bacterium]